MARTKKRPTNENTSDPNAELDKKLRALQVIHQDIEQAFVLMQLNGITEDNTAAFRFILNRHRQTVKRIVELLTVSTNKKLHKRVELFIENDTDIIRTIKNADDPVFKEGFENILSDFVEMRDN